MRLALALAFAFALAAPAHAAPSPAPSSAPAIRQAPTITNDSVAQVLAAKADLWDKYRPLLAIVYGPYCTAHGGLTDVKPVGQGTALAVCKDGSQISVAAPK